MEKGRYYRKKRYIFLFIIGMMIFLYPAFSNLYYYYVTMRSPDYGISSTGPAQNTPEAAAISEKDFKQIESDPEMTSIIGKDEQFVEAYNDKLWNQSGATPDPFGDGSSPVKSAVVADSDDGSVFAYIEIPQINQKLPVYLGATEDHLVKGAAVIQGTSIPVGGENTNSVIAGHTGMVQKLFTDLPELEPGDRVIITNRWGTLYYRVTGNKIIWPDQEEYLDIIPGKDMITLLTCYHGTVENDRLLVFAERYYPGNTAAIQQQATVDTNNKTATENQQAENASGTATGQNAEIKTEAEKYSYATEVELQVKNWYEKPQTYMTAVAVLLAGLFLYTLIRKNKKLKI